SSSPRRCSEAEGLPYARDTATNSLRATQRLAFSLARRGHRVGRGNPRTRRGRVVTGHLRGVGTRLRGRLLGAATAPQRPDRSARRDYALALRSPGVAQPRVSGTRGHRERPDGPYDEPGRG